MSGPSDELENSPVKKKPRVKSESLWMMTFSDLSFVLMCFFALLLSFSSMDKQKFENVRDGVLAKSPEEIKNEKPVKKKKNNLKNLSKKILDEIKRQKLQATVIYDVDGVAVELDTRLFFRSGSAQIDTRYGHITKKLMKIVANAPKRYKMTLEGHTDDVPLGKRARYRSNWELSSARGVSLLEQLKRLGVAEKRLSVVSYAHTRPKVPVKGKKGKDLALARAKNRRVVIRIQ